MKYKVIRKYKAPYSRGVIVLDDKIFWFRKEPKPIKIVRENIPVKVFTEEDLNNLIEKIGNAGYGGFQPNFIPTSSLVEKWGSYSEIDGEGE